jgi:hypothetical protein
MSPKLPRHIKVMVAEKDSTIIEVNFVPQFSFVVQRGNQKEENDPHSMVLPNNAAVMRYAI